MLQEVVGVTSALESGRYLKDQSIHNSIPWYPFPSESSTLRRSRQLKSSHPDTIKIRTDISLRLAGQPGSCTRPDARIVPMPARRFRYWPVRDPVNTWQAHVALIYPRSNIQTSELLGILYSRTIPINVWRLSLHRSNFLPRASLSGKERGKGRSSADIINPALVAV